ncbi:MAG: NADH-quinone oxidoreductase subunit C [Candidatus Omnitrophota bacterium]
MEDVLGRIREKFYEQIIKYEEKSPRRVYIEFAPQNIPEAVKFLFRDLNLRFATATAIDTPLGIEILYHFSYDPKGQMVSLRTFITDKKHPQIESIAPIIKGAEWIEREMWEMLGINLIGHPNLKHLLLIDDWPEGKFPLRKEK